MKITYRRIASPFQVLRSKAFDVQERKHPVREEIQKLIGSFSISALFEEDTATLALLNRVPGLVSFLCTLSKDGVVISQGRGSAVLNRSNRFIDRSINAAYGAAFVDASVRCAKVLDTLRPGTGEQGASVAIGEAYKDDIFEPASSAQKS